MRMRLPLRLFLSYAAVVVVGAVVAYLTVRLLAPALFDHQVGMMNGNGMGMQMGLGAATQAGVHDAFQSALNTALIVGLVASVAAAVVVAWFVTRRLMRPLNAVRTATRQIAAGGYEVSVPAAVGAGVGGAGDRCQHPRGRARRHRDPAHPAAR